MDKHKKLITLLVTGALAVTAALGAAGYRTVFAQAPTTMPTAPDAQTLPPSPAQGKPWAGGQRGRGHFTDQDLAAALGITTDELQAAYQSANEAALREAVSAGLITQTQADQLAANGFGQRRFEGFGIFGVANEIDYNALLAQALNITSDQLQAAYTQAYTTSLDTAVQNGNLTQEQAELMKGEYALANDASFKASMQSAYEAALNQAVTDGAITQPQADAILAQRSQGGRPGFGPGLGGPGGRGHGGPGFFGGPGNRNNQQNQTPSTVPSDSGL